MKRVPVFLEKTVKNVSFVLFSLIVAGLFLCSIVSSCNVNWEEYTLYQRDSCIGMLLGLMVICVAGYFFQKQVCGKWNEKTKRRIWYGCLILYGIALAVFTFYLQFPPRADQRNVIQVAKHMLQADYSDFQKGGYASIYPNQYGMIYIFYILLKYIPVGYHSFRFLNVVSIVMAVYLLEELGKLMFENCKENKGYGFMGIGFMPLFFYVTFLYGNNLGLALSLGGMVCVCKYIKIQRWPYFVIGGILLGLSVVVKENYLIMVLAAGILLLVSAWKEKKWNLGLFLVYIVMAVCVLSQLVNSRMESITQTEKAKGVPALAWVVMGMQCGYMADGWHNSYNYKVFEENDYNTEKTKEVVKDDFGDRIEEMIHTPLQTAKFYCRKTLSQWNNPTFECFWINDIQKCKKEHVSVRTYPAVVRTVLGEPGNKGLYLYMNLFQSAAWLGILGWIVFRGRKAELIEYTGIVVFLGGFLFHTIWEAKCQYTLPYFFFVLPYAVVGFREIIGWFEQKRKKK